MEWTRGNYTITTDADRIDRAAVRRFLADSYWAAGRPADVIDRSLDRSLAFALIHDGRQVGMARVVTDSATFAWLCDVYIEPGHRGGGLGQWLVSAVLSHPDLEGVGRWMLGTSYSHSLYRRLGFDDVPPGKFMMRRRDAGSADPG